MPRNAVQWCFHFSLFCRMSSTAGSQQSVWISATISCPLSNQSSKRTTQGKRVIENVSELNKNSPYSPSRSYFEHLKCWKIRTFLVVIFSNLTHASYQSLKITSHTFSFLYTCQITQVKWNEQILSEIVTGLMWCLFRLVYLFTWDPHRDVTYAVHRDSPYTFLPEWYIKDMSSHPSSHHWYTELTLCAGRKDIFVLFMHILYGLPLLLVSMNALDSVCGLGQNSFTKHFPLDVHVHVDFFI